MEVVMARKVKWLSMMLYTAAIVGALGFSAHQAFAARRSMDPCSCTMPGQTDVCANAECCNEAEAVCGTGFFCVCA
jgi:hypothetical protein